MLKWLRQCASALKYLHNQSKIHRNIKPSNIFLTPTDDVKIGDFGLTDDGAFKNSKGCRSDLYYSTEVNKDHQHNCKSDIWFVYSFLFNFPNFMFAHHFFNQGLLVYHFMNYPSPNFPLNLSTMFQTNHTLISHTHSHDNSIH